MTFSNPFELLVLLFACHFLADYPLQGPFLSEQKNPWLDPERRAMPWWQALGAHAFIHSCRLRYVPDRQRPSRYLRVRPALLDRSYEVRRHYQFQRRPSHSFGMQAFVFCARDGTPIHITQENKVDLIERLKARATGAIHTPNEAGNNTTYVDDLRSATFVLEGYGAVTDNMQALLKAYKTRIEVLEAANDALSGENESLKAPKSLLLLKGGNWTQRQVDVLSRIWLNIKKSATRGEMPAMVLPEGCEMEVFYLDGHKEEVLVNATILTEDQTDVAADLIRAIQELPGMHSHVLAYLMGTGYDDPDAELKSLTEAVGL